MIYLNCHTCRQSKAPKDQYNVLLNLLLKPIYASTNITLDLVTGLSLNNGYNAILIVIDQLTKERHYIFLYYRWTQYNSWNNSLFISKQYLETALSVFVPHF